MTNPQFKTKLWCLKESFDTIVDKVHSLTNSEKNYPLEKNLTYHTTIYQ